MSLRDVVRRLVGEARPRLHHRALAELEVGLALAAGDVEVDLLALLLELLDEALGLLEDVRGVGTRETPVAGDDQDRRPLGVLGLRASARGRRWRRSPRPRPHGSARGRTARPPGPAAAP